MNQVIKRSKIELLLDRIKISYLSNKIVHDFVIDIESFGAKNDQKSLFAKMKALEMVQNPQIQAMLTQEQQKVKIKELLSKTLEEMGFQDADQYFEQIQLVQAGAGNPASMPMGGGAGPVQGVGGGNPPAVAGQGQQLMARPAAVPNQPRV
jgi:hypothetical protein